MKLSYAYAMVFSFSSLCFSSELLVQSGNMYFPLQDGSFSSIQADSSVAAFYTTLTESQYVAYSGDSALAYGDYLLGKFDNSTERKGMTCAVGWANYAFQCYEECDTAYVLAIFTCSKDGKSYYIAKASTFEMADNPFDENVVFLHIAESIGRWTLVAPSEPLTISCVGLAVTSGVVTATFSISDTSRYGEIISNGMATVTVATDLAGTDRHGLSASATTDASSGTFTVVFPVPSNTSRLFIFGVQ